MIDAHTLATPLEMSSRVVEAIQSTKVDSLPEYTAPTRLSPVVLIDKSVLSVEQGLLHSLLQTLTSIYSAHYLQAVNIAMNVGDVKVLRLLDKFSTDRDILRAAGNSAFLGMEAYDLDGMELPSFSMEAIRDGDEPQRLRGGRDNDKTIRTITDESNLAVGKVIEVKVQSGEHQISIPVTVSLIPKSMSSEELVSITEAKSIDRTLKGRFHAWRSGEIRFIKDYLLALDLVEADKKALMADSTGTLLSNRSKRSKGILAALVSGQASPNAISTMVVVSKGTAKEMELALRGKLKSSKTRDAYFQANSAMMLVVVDTTLERFTLYQRGIDDYSEYTLEDIKANGSKPNGVDIESVLKAYKLGDSPTL